MRLARTTLAAATLAGIVACAPGPTPATRPNLLLIVADALRADRLGAYGSTRGLTPFLDSVAARGIVFENAYSASSWTNPSVASLLTSRRAWQHGVNSPSSVLAADETTLAEVLAEHGYATSGHTANFIFGEGNGFAQGFGTWTTLLERQVDGISAPVLARPDDVNGAALAWWRRERDGGRPAFVYLHYAQPHQPYAPPRDSVAHVFPGPLPPPDVNVVNAATAFFSNLLRPGDQHAGDIEGYYDADVLALDRALERLFAGLEREGFLRDAVVVLTADHGEELWDHGRFGHGRNLFQEVIRVPLIMLVPSRDTRFDVPNVVSTADVAPTLLDFAGIQPPASFAGRSLRVLLEPRACGSDPGLAPCGESGPRSWPDEVLVEIAMSEKAKSDRRDDVHRQAVIVGAKKLITTRDGEPEYYDLAADPRERAPAPLTDAERAQLAEALARLGPPAGARPRVTDLMPLDEERQRKLRAIGYVE